MTFWAEPFVRNKAVSCLYWRRSVKRIEFIVFVDIARKTQEGKYGVKNLQSLQYTEELN